MTQIWLKNKTWRIQISHRTELYYFREARLRKLDLNLIFIVLAGCYSQDRNQGNRKTSWKMSIIKTDRNCAQKYECSQAKMEKSTESCTILNYFHK